MTSLSDRGAPLARLEGQIAIQMLLERTHGLRLVVSPDTIRWRSGLVLRGVVNLPVIVHAGKLSGATATSGITPRQPEMVSDLVGLHVRPRDCLW
jgi:hypothetical protein